MNGQPPTTSSRVASRPSRSSWITVSFETPGPASSISNEDLRRRVGADGLRPQRLECHGEPAGRVGREDHALDRRVAVGPELVRAADGPVGVDRAVVVVLEREARVGERLPDAFRRAADVGREDVARGSGHVSGLRCHRCLQCGAKLVEQIGGPDPVAVEPSIVDAADRDGVEVVVALAPDLAGSSRARPPRGPGDASSRRTGSSPAAPPRALPASGHHARRAGPAASAGSDRPAPGTPRRPCRGQ